MNGSNDSRDGHGEIIDQVRGALAARGSGARGDLPFVTLTYAQGLDGSIAHSECDKLVLSNEHSQRLTHHVRALHDAILVGINTVLSDDPRLNVRLVEGPSPQPVVVDTRLRFPLDARLLRAPCVSPIIASGHSDERDPAEDDRERRLKEAGARIIRLPLQEDGAVDLVALLARLKQMGFQSIMIEGGAEIITSVLSLRLADQFLLTIAPRFVCGLHAVKSECGVDAQYLQPRNVGYHWLAGDLIVRGDFVRGPTPAAQSNGTRLPLDWPLAGKVRNVR